ncbi:hypothetical protein OKJ48_11870, partial [Streptomyces kunmingensis]|nr:hypothetical protein [Streptomyces kunmingensis]
VLARCLHKDPAQRPTTDQLAAQLHDGRGEFVDHLPPELLAVLGRRAAEVWRLRPQRLPAPQGSAETAPAVPPRGPHPPGARS